VRLLALVPVLAAVAVGFCARPGAAATESFSAAFVHTSYAAGSIAALVVTAPRGPLTVQPVDGAEVGATRATRFAAPPLAPPRTVRWRGGTRALFVSIGNWPSGVYFFRIRATANARLVPVVVRSRVLGQVRAAVVVPTYTWQAYNFRDGDTWYACACVHTVVLSRPYEGSGIPPHFAGYERGFLRWLELKDERVDFLSDEDLQRFGSGDQLRRLYRLVVFSGHEEYVTRHQYDLVTRYRDLGGHLMFLSANSFFREVDVVGPDMTLVGRWRDLGRPEAALVGAQYVDWNHGVYPNEPYRVAAGAARLPWLLAGTRLRSGALIDGSFGIEIDGLSSTSPPQTLVLAEIQDIFGSESAEMTYYTTPRGAEVFDAGVMNFGGSAQLPDVSTLLTNLWTHMA
jgi:hypothetical protein